MDGRHLSYITYEIEVILYIMLLKNVCSPASMQEMAFNEDEEEIVSIETVYKRKPKIKATHKMKRVNNLEYTGHTVTVMELEIDKNDRKWREFQRITSIKIIGETAYAFSETGRKRWLIENEGFNIQKNHRYFITHANSLNYNAMKNHYLLTQLADMLLQLYERGVKDSRL